MQIIQDAPLSSLCPRFMEEEKVKGLSIALVKQGHILASEVFGVRDEAGTKVTADTVFECASLTKVLFACLALCHLERLQISLDEPIAPRLGEAPWSDSPWFGEITPAHVLSHASGLVNWASRPIPMQFAPGHGFLYSGEGYFLLQHMLEHNTGKTMDCLMDEAIFRPLHMDASACVWTPSLSRRFSAGFDADGKPCKIRTERRVTGNGPEPNAAWSLYANAGEYAVFLSALLSDPLFRRTLDIMRLPRNTAPCGIQWGLGLGLCPAEPSLFWHWGDNTGFQSLFVCDAQTGDGLVAVTNSSQGLSLCFRLLEAYTDLPEGPAQSIRQFIWQAE